jgi:drug/metabolite transporter (DMT)-like permease
MRLSDWLLLLALGTLWGGSFFFAAVALAELPPLTIVLSRVGIAAILNAMTPLFPDRPQPRRHRRARGRAAHQGKIARRTGREAAITFFSQPHRLIVHVLFFQRCGSTVVKMTMRR